MKYSYETQGASTYLVCELEPADQLDGLTLGMLTNNHIPGVAPVIYTEMNGQQYLKYNISAKISSDQFFSMGITKDRTLLGLKNILDALCSADDYMIDINCFSLAKEQVFLNVSSCEAALICIPVVSQENINTRGIAFFKESLENCSLGQQDKPYVDELMNYLQEETAFSVYGLKELVTDLQSGARKPVAVAKSVPTPPPVSPFDSTVSIEDMPNLAGKPAVPPVATPPVAGNVAVPPAPPKPVVPTPPAPPRPMAPPPVTPSVAPPPVKPPVAPPVAPPAPPRPPVAPAPPKPPVAPAPPVNIPKPPVSNGPGFAIPGQSGVGKAAVPPAPAPQKQPKQPKVKDPNKKMSFFGLLANYNKENAELYKQQKAQAKAQKATVGNGVPAPAPAPVQGGGAPAGMPGGAPVGGYPMGGGMAQPPMPPQPPRPAVQPVPVQNSFNETTVLSPVMLSGETTVLSAETGPACASLIRLKTGEKINVNKPVFRIGKEKSYVDFFIADNTAISRSHANIHNENGEYFIEDTNSTNHTYVNGQMINSNVKVKLTSGDKIKLANEEFTFTI